MNKPVVKTEDLVDFKENIIFKNEKNKPFNSSDDFKAMIYKKYKYIATFNLYRKIVNYQLKNFSRTLRK